MQARSCLEISVRYNVDNIWGFSWLIFLLTASFADFGIVGMLQWFKRMDEGILQKAREIEPALGALYDASSAWLVRDDY